MEGREKVARVQKGEAGRKESSLAGAGSFRADSPDLGFTDGSGQWGCPVHFRVFSSTH